MLHVSCDLCGKKVQPGDDPHYVVKIEVFAARDPSELTEADLDDDHLEAVSQLLRELNDAELDPDAELPAHKNFRFDLCVDCRKKFVRDPLSREPTQKFDFSKN